MKEQDEIQSAHWNTKPLSIFTAFVWSKSENFSFALPSLDLTHDKFVVNAALKIILNHIETVLPNVVEVNCFSDGAASQFKQRFLFRNLIQINNERFEIFQKQFAKTSQRYAWTSRKGRLEKKLKIKLLFSYPYKLQSQFNHSLKVPSKSVIYQILCSCKEIYVGQTKVSIDNRMKQDSKVINDNENNSNSEMVKHFQEKKFQRLFDTNDAFIIEEENDYWKRHTKEAIYSIVSESV
ncbi:unnamed protein product [Rotaria socialis]